MSDELTARIAEVLAAHHDVRTAGFGRWSECSCSPRALLEAEFIAHQAEQVRAALGATEEQQETCGLDLDKHDEGTGCQIVLERRYVTPWTEVTS